MYVWVFSHSKIRFTKSNLDWFKVQGVDRSQWFFQTKLNLVWNFHNIDNGHQNFPNQPEFGLESASCKTQIFLSKPNWSWFGKFYVFFGCIFSKPNWIWFGKGHWMKCSCSAVSSRFDNHSAFYWSQSWLTSTISGMGDPEVIIVVLIPILHVPASASRSHPTDTLWSLSEPDNLFLFLFVFQHLSAFLANSNSICNFGRLLVFYFSAADESGAKKALSPVCLSGLSEVGSIHFSEFFTNSSAWSLSQMFTTKFAF